MDVSFLVWFESSGLSSFVSLNTLIIDEFDNVSSLTSIKREKMAAGKANPTDVNQMTAKAMMMNCFILGPAAYDCTGFTMIR